MHVAVCDDNIADRKQTERLLSRESDRRAKITEGLFVDSYGNEPALLNNPMQYDIFYIDMCKTDGTDGTQTARKLCQAGVQVPIYLCCSQIDYRKFDLPQNIFFLDKPLKIEDLRTSLDHAQEVKSKAVSLIELRDTKETYYVTEPDILYATQKRHNMLVQLSNGQIITIATQIDNLYAQWQNYKCFVLPNRKTIINAKHITKIGGFQVHMTDGAKIRLDVSQRAYIQEAYLEHHS